MAGSEPDASDVFDVVSNETRVDVLQALVGAYSESPLDPWLGYTELRDAAGVRDNGNFNYHLDQLGGLVVSGEAGYRVSRVGMAVASALASGVFDDDWTWGPVDAPGTCLDCGDPVELRYADGNLWLGCGADGHELALSVPPSLLEGAEDGPPIERIAFVEHQWAAMTRQGICAECFGPVDGRVTVGPGGDHHDYRGRCRTCGFHHGLPVGLFVSTHPAVVSFYDERGTDVRTVPFWTLDWCAPGAETVIDTDPLRVRVGIREGTDTLLLTIDEAGDVVSVA